MKFIAFKIIACISIALGTQLDAQVPTLGLFHYEENLKWSHYSLTCGTRTEQLDRLVYSTGDFFEYATYVEDDCFNADYGFTEYTVDQYWPVVGDGYYHRYGSLGGSPIDEWASPSPFP